MEKALCSFDLPGLLLPAFNTLTSPRDFLLAFKEKAKAFKEKAGMEAGPIV
jgi:hypothetical protein